mgnify:CR=1 FL=1
MIKEIIKDRDLFLDIEKYPIYLIGANIKNSNGNGWQHKISRNFPYVAQINKESNYDDVNKLGTCTVVESRDNHPMFIFCYITKGRFRPDLQPDTLDYEALKSCLTLLNNNFKGKTIASTILASVAIEAGGNKECVLKLFDEYAPDVNFYLYDYVQIDYREEDNQNYNKIYEDYKSGIITKDEYYIKKKEFLHNKKYGIYG